MSDLLEIVLSPAKEEVPRNDSVISFNDGRLRPQDVILNMLAQGAALSDIANFLNMPEAHVEKIASSQWMEEELKKLVDSRPESDLTTIKSVMKSQAFQAVIKLGKLLNSTSDSISLQAAKTILEYNLVPAKDAEFGKRKGLNLPSSQEDLEKQYAEAQRKIAIERERERKVI